LNLTAVIDKKILVDILHAFNIHDGDVQSFGSGLINRTWKVSEASGNYILQRINDEVFRNPKDIAHNIRAVSDHLNIAAPSYYFIKPIPSKSGEDIIFTEAGWFRLMPFAEGSQTFDVAESPHQANEAAKQFGRFTKLLSGFDVDQLKITIPQFHDLSLRYGQFINAIKQGDTKRIQHARSIICALLAQKDIVDRYEQLIRNPQFKLRVTHHDTKISNVLFDKKGNGLCVIDPDTIMPGYFISDVGDMMRTYLSPVSEEETDDEKIIIRKEYLDAVTDGYCEEMQNELTAIEKEHFLFAGEFSIYMQALRFLTDYLQNDIYYGAKYELHNYMRAKNQVTLLGAFQEMMR
jgi:Ser/Thr protein kinase RdoA (MazF antagonist)